MKDYKNSLLVTNLIILISAIALVAVIRIHFFPLLQAQSRATIELVKQDLMVQSTSQTGLNTIADRHFLASLQLTRKSDRSLLQANPAAPESIITATLFPDLTGENSVETDHAITTFSINYGMLSQTVSDLIVQLFALILGMGVLVNLAYFRLLKKLEKSLTNEVASDVPTTSTFSRVTQQLTQQKQRFHKELQDQEQQIQLLVKQVNMDNLTGLSNRHSFRKELTQILAAEGETKTAVLALIRGSELNNINQHRGYQQGDAYLADVGKILVKVVKRYPECLLYRISGSDFAVLAEGMTISTAQKVAKELKTHFDDYQMLNNLESVAYTGLSSIASGQMPEQVLARADMALAKAQTETINAWAFEQQDNQDQAQGQLHWKTVIEEIIKNRSMMLLHQPIQAIHRNMKGYQEIFTRFIGQNNAMIPTETVFVMAQRLDMIVKLEQVILETIVSQCRHKTDGNVRWGVNLSATTMQNSAFVVWLERLLLREPNIAAALIFEMEEEVLDRNLVASKRVFDMLKRTGSRSAISKFGKGIGSFRLFKELKPDFVKIDSGLITNIERDSANQQFLRMIVDVAHRMGSQVIAEGVEHLEQKQLLENMYIDGLQGYLIARPSPLSKSSI